jgi:predicted alpha/beta hydrolase family esterase
LERGKQGASVIEKGVHLAQVNIGLYNSGPAHWQTLWEKHNPAFRRVMQADWERPNRADWVTTLQQAVSTGDWPAGLALLQALR